MSKSEKARSNCRVKGPTEAWNQQIPDQETNQSLSTATLSQEPGKEAVLALTPEPKRHFVPRIRVSERTMPWA